MPSVKIIIEIEKGPNVWPQHTINSMSNNHERNPFSHCYEAAALAWLVKRGVYELYRFEVV